jgi:hypothetical protein
VVVWMLPQLRGWWMLPQLSQGGILEGGWCIEEVSGLKLQHNVLAADPCYAIRQGALVEV